MRILFEAKSLLPIIFSLKVFFVLNRLRFDINFALKLPGNDKSRDSAYCCFHQTNRMSKKQKRFSITSEISGPRKKKLKSGRK